MTKKLWFGSLITAIAALWIWLAVAPLDRSDWLLENVLLVLGVLVLLGTRKRLPL